MAQEGSEPVQDRPIQELREHVAAMGQLALGMVTDGTRAFLAQDPALMESVIARDGPLDAYDLAIETETIRTIARLQPEGADVRTLGATLKIANCVDRIGRLGYDIAIMAGPAAAPADDRPFALLRKMEPIAVQMGREAIAAFTSGDAPRAKRVFAIDDEVDGLHRDVQRQVLDDLVRGGPGTTRLARALLAARHLERVGDNSGKIAEKAVYAITGERRTEYFPKRVRRLEPIDGPAP